jgi:ribosome-binding ATPase YchF (GTP1/OBG family)
MKKIGSGIAEMPSVDKSLLFNLIAKRYPAGTANDPFCTIESNLAPIEVADECFI